MTKWQRVTGQVLLAVGGVLALGGIASFVFPNVELRVWKRIVSTAEARLVWIAFNTTLAFVGLWMLRRSNRS